MLRDILNQFLFPLQLLIATAVFTGRGKKRAHFFWKFLAGFLLLTGLGALIAPFWPVNIVIKFGAVVLFVYVCYEKDLMQALFDATCAYAAQHLAYELSLLIAGSLHLGFRGHLAVQAAVFTGVYTAAWFCFVRKMREYQDVIADSAETVLLMCAILFVAVFLTSNTITLPPANVVSGLENPLTEERTIEVLIRDCSLYSAACCVFILWIQISSRKQLKLQHELDIQRQLWLSHKNQYELSRETIDIINQKCHDLKYQVAALREFYEKDQRDAYLDRIEDSIMIYDSTSKTGNEILDTILTEKKLICEKNRIQFTCVADGACLGFMDPIDLYAIVTNALNNAIDCVMQLKDPGQRVIALKVYERAGVAFIQTENYFPGRLQLREDGLPVTTKSDDTMHGFGLKSIRRNVEKYSGYLHIDTENEMFTLRISFPSAQ